MKRITFLAGAAALSIGIIPGASCAQQPQGSQPFVVGNALGCPSPRPPTERSTRSHRT